MREMDADFAPLFSGSSGNAAYIRRGETRVLVDAGVSAVRVEKELRRLDVAPETLSALLITHEHADHIQGAGVLSRRFHLPVYATEGTWRAMEGKLGRIAPENRREICPGRDFYLGEMNVTPFEIPHDAAQPVGYAFAGGRFRVAVATDLGHVAPEWLELLCGQDILLLEANHDPDMLAAGPYPYDLKKRIRGARGHLSNGECGQAAACLTREGVKQIILGHLSAQNNFPELAWRTVADALDQAGICPGEDVGLTVAGRDGAGSLYHLESEAAACASR